MTNQQQTRNNLHQQKCAVLSYHEENLKMAELLFFSSKRSFLTWQVLTEKHLSRISSITSQASKKATNYQLHKSLIVPILLSVYELQTLLADTEKMIPGIRDQVTKKIL